jgi:hypothetical protein
MSKITRAKTDGAMAQAVECLPRKHETPVLNPCTSKKLKQKTKQDDHIPIPQSGNLRNYMMKS